MGMVAIERVYVTWFLKGTWLKTPQTAKRIIVTIIVSILVFNSHEAIFYQSVEDPKFTNVHRGAWCVTAYPPIIAKYNQVNVILNYIMPFLDNILSTTILIILITRKRATAVQKKTDHSNTRPNAREAFRSYIHLLIQYRELIFAPLVIMVPQLFALPQFILSFSLACQEFSVDWQRYFLIVSYFLTYLPQVFSYKLYISPSSFYRNEFIATKLYQKIIA